MDNIIGWSLPDTKLEAGQNIDKYKVVDIWFDREIVVYHMKFPKSKWWVSEKKLVLKNFRSSNKIDGWICPL